jgi:tetratricopeptide (TPR) repeat protein
VYGELKQYEESEKYLRKAIDIRSLVYGDDNPLLAGVYNSLGVTLLDQKKYTLAKPYFEKALKIRLNTYGNLSPKVSLCYGNLGRLYKEIGNKEEAIKCFNDAISSLPEDHPNVAILKKKIDDILKEK